MGMASVALELLRLNRIAWQPRGLFTWVRLDWPKVFVGLGYAKALQILGPQLCLPPTPKVFGKSFSLVPRICNAFACAKTGFILHSVSFPSHSPSSIQPRQQSSLLLLRQALSSNLGQGYVLKLTSPRGSSGTDGGCRPDDTRLSSWTREGGGKRRSLETGKWW